MGWTISFCLPKDLLTAEEERTLAAEFGDDGWMTLPHSYDRWILEVLNFEAAGHRTIATKIRGFLAECEPEKGPAPYWDRVKRQQQKEVVSS